MKFIVVTGGVMSGIGKGITASSIGVILKKYGYSVTAIKIDPYLNQDAGTISPYEHGEVYLLKDGGETDLDLGNYERFLNTTLTKDHNITSGKIWKNVLEKERKGDFLGKTVQIIPHITNEIKEWIFHVSNMIFAGSLCAVDFCIIELGGTIGDMESMPYVEALKQMYYRNPEDIMFVHVSYLPTLKSTKEVKTKPTQQSVKELRGLGIIPDFICLRCESELKNGNDMIIEKVSQSCGVSGDSIIIMPDQSSIYKVPLLFDEFNIMKNIKRKFSNHIRTMNKINTLDHWSKLANYIDRCKECIQPDLRIAVVGKYTNMEDAYLSLRHAIEHAGFYLNKTVNIDFIDATTFDNQMIFNYNYSEKKYTLSQKHHDIYKQIEKYDAFIIPGGFDKRGTVGMINIISLCRYYKIPILGICLGMQLMVIDISKHIYNNQNANSAEFIDFKYRSNSDIQKLSIVKMSDLNQNMGGTMRLGLKKTLIKSKSCVYDLYKKFDLIKKDKDGNEYINERYRHRYEVNPDLTEPFGNLFVGNIGDRQCILEKNDNGAYYVGCQYHPEYQTYPFKPHPLFVGLLESGLKYNMKNDNET